MLFEETSRGPAARPVITHGMAIIFACVAGTAATFGSGPPALAEGGQSALGMIVDDENWEIGCDNLRGCVALGMNPEEGKPGSYLRVTRDGDPNAEPVFEIVIPAPEDEAAKPKQPVGRFLLQGAGAVDLADGAVALRAEDDSYRYTVPAGAMGALVGALSPTGSLIADLYDGDKKLASNVISLAGASAALAEMDEVQQRSGTMTALIRRGSASADTIPAPPAVKVVKSLPLAALQDPLPRPPKGAMAAEKQCEDSVPPRVAYDLGQGSVLWGACASVDDNNVDYVFQMFAGNEDQNVAFLLPGEPGDDATHLYNPYVDDETRRLGSFYKQNDVGDCGSATEWAFDGEIFAPTLYISMGACRGVMPVDWPVLYRADVE